MGGLKILILDDERGGVQHLHDALGGKHSLTWVRSIEAGFMELSKKGRPFDAIICGTHLLTESMFDFLSQVKKQAESKKIPFICFRAATTEFAEKIDGSIENTVKMLGAHAYIAVPDISDPENLRAVVETELRQLVSNQNE